MYTDNDLKIDLIKYQNYGQFFFFFLPLSMWDLFPQPRIETAPSAVGIWSRNYWTTREVLVSFFFVLLFFWSIFILDILCF